jgi:hypothetical protein
MEIDGAIILLAQRSGRPAAVDIRILARAVR